MGIIIAFRNWRVRVGAVLGTYELIELICEGGMGAVYRARDSRLGREVAIKVIRPELASIPTASPDSIAKHGCSPLSITPISNGVRIEPIHHVPFLVMELIAGETLADRSDFFPLPAKEALTIGGQIAAAMEAADDRGVIHRPEAVQHQNHPEWVGQGARFRPGEGASHRLYGPSDRGLPHTDVRRHRGSTVHDTPHS